MTDAPSQRPVSESMQEYGRGVLGGLIFSLPLLYTMEVWQHGLVVRPGTLVGCIGVTFLLLLGYNRYGGMHPDARWWEIAVESIEELGIALVLSPLVLFLLGRIGSHTSWDEVLGVTVIEAMTVAIGVSVGTAQLQGGGNNGNGNDSQKRRPVTPWGEIVLAFCGAFLFAANVAPTEEVVVIGLETGPLRLLGVVAMSLLLGAVTLFYSGFLNAGRYVRRDTTFQVAFGVVTSYGAALVASALILWFFRRFDGVTFAAVVSQTVVLALPGMLGASAGRLMIQ